MMLKWFKFLKINALTGVNVLIDTCIKALSIPLRLSLLAFVLTCARIMSPIVETTKINQ